MATSFSDKRNIKLTRVDADSPDSALNWKDIIEKVQLLEDLVRSIGFVQGAADSDPVTTTLVDTNPTFGSLDLISVGEILEITKSIRAERKRFTVSSTTATTITTEEDMQAAGVRSGDEYRIIFRLPGQFSPSVILGPGHTHDGIDSNFINIQDITELYFFADL